MPRRCTLTHCRHGVPMTAWCPRCADDMRRLHADAERQIPTQEGGTR